MNDPATDPGLETGAHAATPAELEAMRRACTLAARGTVTARPNPAVGCVLLDPTGAVIGEGFHAHAGGPHAEVVALTAAGEAARGATAVVTLEPCNHTGRTGPCSEALIDAGIARVIVGVRDPWKPAAGGIERLRAAGVDVVDVGAHRLAGGAYSETVDLARDTNRFWLTTVECGRPFVTLKMATSIDGRVAAPDGSSRWISSPESRDDAHRLRAEIDAIIVGVGTVVADDPSLTARRQDGELADRQPLRVIADTHGRTPSHATVRGPGAPTWVATAAEIGTAQTGHLDLAAMLSRLHDDGAQHVLVEGGPTLAAAFLDAGLVDEVLLYLAPMLLGAGRTALDGGAITTLTEAHRFALRTCEKVGPDLVMRYRRVAPEQSDPG